MALLSLAIPTNGIIEWVFPVLDSIYRQSVDENLFEVIVTDNGDNDLFYNKMLEYKKKHRNLIYQRNESKLFMNQIEAFKLASGEYIKFVNHRTKVRDGSIQYLVEFVEKNIHDRPITYFLNGIENKRKKVNVVNPFDSFVYELSYNSSWSGGVGIWKNDFEILEKSGNIMRYNGLFPHLAFVFIPYDNRKYFVDNKKIFDEIPNNTVKKGKYDLFKAFGVDYLNAIKDLLHEKYIEFDTYNHIKNDNQKFIENLYAEYVILHKSCSYDLSSAKNSLNQYYSYNEIRKNAKRIAINRIIGKVKKLGRRSNNAK